MRQRNTISHLTIDRHAYLPRPKRGLGLGYFCQFVHCYGLSRITIYTGQPRSIIYILLSESTMYIEILSECVPSFCVEHPTFTIQKTLVSVLEESLRINDFPKRDDHTYTHIHIQCINTTDNLEHTPDDDDNSTPWTPPLILILQHYHDTHENETDNTIHDTTLPITHIITSETNYQLITINLFILTNTRVCHQHPLRGTSQITNKIKDQQ